MLLSRGVSTTVLRHLSGFLVILGLAFSAGAGAPAPRADVPDAARAPLRALKITSDTTLPSTVSEWASDVRWASDRRVYLGLGMDGTIEADLEPAGAQPKEMIPGRNKPGGQWSSRYVAASSRYLVAAGSAFALSWRRLDAPELSTLPFDGIQAVDVRENRLAVVGARRDEKDHFAAEGAIAWVGSLDKQLADLKPLLYDAAGPGAPTFNRCLAFSLATARFLPDGSLAVLAGIQPGLNLYDREGKLVRTWDTQGLGIDTDCASLSSEQASRLAASGAQRQQWINQRRTVDALLPLPQGIGLVVRRVEEGRTRWELKVLRPLGAPLRYAIPIEGSNGSFNLTGDVRAGRVVFLLRETLFSSAGRAHPIPPRLILAEVTEG